MEFQAKQETSKQDFLLKQTQDSVLNAYRQAQIGLGQQRIDETGQQIAGIAQRAAAKAAAPKADPIAMKNFETQQSLYENAAKQYQRAQASEKPEIQATAEDWATAAKTYKDRADAIAKTIQGTATPAGTYQAATSTGTSPAPVTAGGDVQARPPSGITTPDVLKAEGRRGLPADVQKAQGTKVRDRATGKTFIYRGDPTDIPTDQYDVLE
jgi:hypothetical protein